MIASLLKWLLTISNTGAKPLKLIIVIITIFLLYNDCIPKISISPISSVMALQEIAFVQRDMTCRLSLGCGYLMNSWPHICNLHMYVRMYCNVSIINN